MEIIWSTGSILKSSLGLIDIGVKIPSSGNPGELVLMSIPVHGLRSTEGDFEHGVNGRWCGV